MYLSLTMDISAIIQRVNQAPGFRELAASLPSHDRNTAPALLDHTDTCGVPFAVAWAIRAVPARKRIWIVTPNLKVQESLYSQLETWGIKQVSFLPDAEEHVPGVLVDPDTAAERLNILQSIYEPGKSQQIVVLTRQALNSRVPDFSANTHSNSLQLKVGTTFSPEKLSRLCTDNGFEFVPQVVARGQWSKRGGIFDIFPLQTASPIRFEFFDNEIESIRSFDIDSQISFKKQEQALIVFQERDSQVVLRSWITSDDFVITTPDSAEYGDLAILNAPPDQVQGAENFDNAILWNPLGTFEAGDFVLQEAKRAMTARQLAEWQQKKWRIAIFFPNAHEEARFREFGEQYPALLEADFIRGDLPRGFVIPSAHLAILSSSELFGKYQTASIRKWANREEQARKIRSQASLKEINPGDLVVHTTHGIGKFIRIAPANETGDEEMQILYKDNTILHVPLSQAHLVSRYIGLGNKEPSLNSLSDTKWQKTRKSAEKAVLDYAARLLDIQARRTAGQGYAHPPDSHWMWDFENSFPYRETPDQLRAIAQTKADMESPKPMDRLICGDVGFGKTEVAIRAAFKCVTGGKQAVILVPTTVLAEQHLRSFRSRMSEYPIRIEMLSRFTPPSEVKSILAGLADGSVDIVVGTHRLVSQDVKIKHPGLVVIDEEQRFGVRHKELFKEIFRNIDVLTLSATPIPRTLYIALMGARDMSTIETPPINRLPVQTSVCPYDERIIRSAIERELARGGQVFFLHNRVKSIEMFRDKIQQLVPKARIVIGHGQMPKDELEEVMRIFVHGDADILLATSIIESGIDIPNANTIIIDRADRFGLADLYQLRGRVGRSGHLAYAYLMLPRSSLTTSDARKRVSAIKQYSALGSGFKIAMRDLEIRGAGNLLGTRQSGHIAAIGFDLYCQLLRQSIDRIQGKTSSIRIDATLKADFIIFSEVRFKTSSPDQPILGAFIPISYIEESRLRIAAYKDLANAQNLHDIDTLESTWRDRFGPLPQEAQNILICQKIKILASLVQISQIEISGQRLMLTRNGDYILLVGKFPRLKKVKPADKLKEVFNMMQKL